MAVHPTAIIDRHARLGERVRVGAYSVIGAHVEIGDGTQIGHHCVLEGRSRIGRNNRIYHFVSLGGPPQDKKYRDEPTRLDIGDDNTIREFCTLNTGTAQDVGVTRLGNRNWIMAYCHIAHDCTVGDDTVFANNAQLAGHVHVGDFAILGGFTVVHQFVHIGAHCLTAMGTIVLQDVPPYMTVSGNPAAPHGINSKGLRRRGFESAAIEGLRKAYRTLYRSGLSLDQAVSTLRAGASELPEVELLLDFLAHSQRGIVR